MNRNRINHRMHGIALVAATWLLTVPAVWAVDAHHPDPDTGPAAAAPPAPARDTEQALRQMKQNTDKLRAQMDKILKTRDPAERRKLMQEHMLTLRASLKTVAGAMGGGRGSGGIMGSGMMGGDMMDCPMMGNMMGGDGAANQAITDRLNQMEKRLDMMQMMIEQMRKP